MREDANHLMDELCTMINEGRKLLEDSEAIPTMYSASSDAFTSPIESATQLLASAPENEETVVRLRPIVDDAKVIRLDLSQRADLWKQFVDERDNATDQLEAKRGPLDEIEMKTLRSYEEVAEDLDKLKV